MFPPGRYGRRRQGGRRRWPARVGVGAAVVIALVIAGRLYTQYGSTDYTPTVLSYSDITDKSVTVTFQVDKTDAPVTCTLQAFTYSDEQVGEAQVPVGRGAQVKVTYTLPTSAKAYVAQIPTCQPAN
jgi:Domain of unknown function (DUF4307)